MLRTRRYGSSELVQLSLVAACLSASWASSHYGISSELGAFIAGAMIAHAFAISGLSTAGGGGGGGSLQVRWWWCWCALCGCGGVVVVVVVCAV